MYKSLFYLTFGAVFLTAAACGGDDEKEPADNPDEVTGGTTGAYIQSGAGGSGGESTETGEDPSEVDIPENCGNGVVEPDLFEECDDGNLDDEDGCTKLCEFTCKEDSKCDDLDPCNGVEVCLDDHTCSPGSNAMSDGSPCGDNASCSGGVCVPHICGDGIKQGDEECDDGDDDDSNGCTKACLFTCVSSRDMQETVVNDCNPDAVCNETTHMWEGGNPLPDGTVCNRQQGYCLNGVCVLAVCGDGVQDPNEECDLGEQNGAENSGCLANCRMTQCGNGIIEGNEMCDDGNNTNIDGCDYRCVAEVTYRGTNLNLTLDEAPSYCIYADNENKGNAFSNLFIGQDGQALLDLVNGFLKGMFDEGQVQTLFHVMDVESYELEPDPLARLGLSMGEPVTDWASSPVKLDLEFNAYRDFYNDELEPLSTVPGAMVIENGRQVVQSTAPTISGFNILETLYVLHDMMSRIETDDNLSLLPPPPETVEGLRAPESVGNHGGTPTGVLCGALHQDAFASMPLPPELLLLCTDQFGEMLMGENELNPCDEGEDLSAGECDSILTWFKTGCSTLFGAVTILEPLGDPDVDTDGDGINDAYTTVLYVSAERVKVVGVMDMPEDMTPQ